MSDIKLVRIDKFLWSVRLFKTRSLATKACLMSRVLINGTNIKPSKEIETGKIITVRKPPVTYTYRVTGIIENRVSAKLVANYIEDITPEDEKLKIIISSGPPIGFRKKGTGRPTKKERRTIDKWTDEPGD